jgi:hypothetical protein
VSHLTLQQPSRTVHSAVPFAEKRTEAGGSNTLPRSWGVEWQSQGPGCCLLAGGPSLRPADLAISHGGILCTPFPNTSPAASPSQVPPFPTLSFTSLTPLPGSNTESEFFLSSAGAHLAHVLLSLNGKQVFLPP